MQEAIRNAMIEGRSAGRLHLAPSLNPYPLGSAEAAAWLRGWSKATAHLARDLRPARGMIHSVVLGVLCWTAILGATVALAGSTPAPAPLGSGITPGTCSSCIGGGALGTGIGWGQRSRVWGQR